MTQVLPWKKTVSYSGLVGGSPSTVNKEPIIFVHGNGGSAKDWSRYFSYFIENGVDSNRLWAISFDSSDMTHDALSNQLEDFVTRILAHSNSSTISFVGHSLGVTVGRFWMEEYNRYENVTNFVGLAGANHGIKVGRLARLATVLPEQHRLKPCQTIGDSLFTTPPIEELNETVGETPGDINYYTVRGELDELFIGCLNSPKLDGAEENLSLWLNHEGVRESKIVIMQVFDWVISSSKI